MKDTFKKWAKEILIFLVFLFFASLVIGYFRSPDVPQNSTILLEKKLVGESSIFQIPKNRPFVVLFWGSWCPVCREDLGNFSIVPDDITLIGVAVNSGDDKVIMDFLKSKNVNMKNINDNDGMVANSFDISTFPTTLFYDSKGVLRFSESGYMTTAGIMARLKLLE